MAFDLLMHIIMACLINIHFLNIYQSFPIAKGRPLCDDIRVNLLGEVMRMIFIFCFCINSKNSKKLILEVKTHPQAMHY
jgi:hypothetical protein